MRLSYKKLVYSFILNTVVRRGGDYGGVRGAEAPHKYLGGGLMYINPRMIFIIIFFMVLRHSRGYKSPKISSLTREI